MTEHTQADQSAFAAREDAPMRKPVKVLVVEDSEDDTKIALRALRDGGFDPTYKRVQDAAELATMLKQEPWDAVIADFKMPNFSGMEALRILRSTELDIPFMLISGAIGEETAVEAMKNGASDYVMKANLARLAPALERQLADAAIRAAHRRTQRELAESEERFRRLTGLSSDWYWELDGNLKYTLISEGFADKFGKDADQCIGKAPWELPGVDADWTALREVLQRGQPFRDFAVRQTRADGTIVHHSLTGEPILNPVGRSCSYHGVGTDTTNVKQFQARLEYLAHHDALTGLPNRLVLLSHLEKSMARARRSQNRCAVLFLDLDRFKNVNDSLGHPAGDELLVLVARRLRERMRSVDTVARVGGDEFLVLLDEVAKPEDAAIVAQSLIDQFKDAFNLSGGHKVYVGAAIGISVFPDDSEVSDQLIQYADAALYQAKAGGKGTFRFYGAEMTLAATARLKMEAHMQRALKRNEFLLHYQPLVCLADGRVKGVEALVRWLSPNNVLIPPDQFIPLAEETGLILPIGDWVLRTACTQMQKWIASGTAPQTMAVNLSPRQFHQVDLCERIREILSETGLPSQRLELEITEGALMDYTGPAATKLSTLKALGVALSIDDFGTGYSSLAYLKHFPIDKLKVDRSFVRDITIDGAGMEIATAIIGLAKNLKLEVLAEGVETEAQLEFLRSRSCDSAQGYLFGRPVPANELRTSGGFA